MPERMCIVTRAVKDEAQLIRFVLSPEGVVVPDLLRKLPGRGVWVSCDKALVAEAAKKGLFARGFASQAEVAPDLPTRVGGMLRQQVISNLSLARKAGEALTGAFKVEEALQRGPVRLLFHGRDAGSDGVRKLNRLARPETLICSFMETAELDLAFGRANVVHAAVAAGGLAEKLAICVSRVAAYEGLAFKDVESEDRI